MFLKSKIKALIKAQPNIGIIVDHLRMEVNGYRRGFLQIFDTCL